MNIYFGKVMRDIFRYDILRMRKNRASLFAKCDSENNFLLLEILHNVSFHINEVAREVGDILILGCHCGEILNFVNERLNFSNSRIIQCDISDTMVKGAKGDLAVNPEFLPFTNNSFDVVISIGNLHWINDLPGCLIQVRNILKPGGIFLGTLMGGETLRELRYSLMKSEEELYGRFTPRVSPFIDVKTAGMLLQRAGFSVPVSDTDNIEIFYSDPYKLLKDLSAMGESNALKASCGSFLSRSTISRMCEIYREGFSVPNDRQCVKAIFEVISLTAKSD